MGEFLALIVTSSKEIVQIILYSFWLIRMSYEILARSPIFLADIYYVEFNGRDSFLSAPRSVDDKLVSDTVVQITAFLVLIAQKLLVLRLITLLGTHTAEAVFLAVALASWIPAVTYHYLLAFERREATTTRAKGRVTRAKN